jgi:hypothetical protein
MCHEVEGEDEGQNKAVKAALPRPAAGAAPPPSALAAPSKQAQRLTTNQIASETIQKPGAAITDIDLSPVSD